MRKTCWREASGAALTLEHWGDGSEGGSDFSQCPSVPVLLNPRIQPGERHPPGPGPGFGSCRVDRQPKDARTNAGCAALCQQMVLGLCHSPAADRCAWRGAGAGLGSPRVWGRGMGPGRGWSGTSPCMLALPSWHWCPSEGADPQGAVGGTGSGPAVHGHGRSNGSWEGFGEEHGGYGSLAMLPLEAPEKLLCPDCSMAWVVYGSPCAGGVLGSRQRGWG